MFKGVKKIMNGIKRVLKIHLRKVFRKLQEKHRKNYWKKKK
jgi:hypothetical protein